MAADDVVHTIKLYNKKSNGKKFSHSLKVPNIYKAASVVLEKHCTGQGSIKKIVYGGSYKNFKKLYAVACKAVDNYAKIQKALKELKVLELHPKLNPYLATVLTSQLVEGKCLQSECKPILTITKYKDELLDKIQKINNSDHEQDNLTYVRINTLKTTADDIHSKLAILGFHLKEYDAENTSYDQFLEIIQSLEKEMYVRDYHVADLLVFQNGQEFWNTDIYKDCRIILQNKASCLPALLSGAEPGMAVIDACAAPGNKTTYLSSMMKNKGSILAVDRDPERFKTLRSFVSTRGATNVKTLRSDFIAVKHEDYDADVILVDPTCSASGTSIHLEKVCGERVNRLAAFQLKILQHALSFPRVQTVVYSTCSVNEDENEAVVQKALEHHGHRFQLADLRKCLRGWKNLGSNTYDCGNMCIRTVSSVDRCQGFFVAKFVTKVPLKKKEKVRCNKLRHERRRLAKLYRAELKQQSNKADVNQEENGLLQTEGNSAQKNKSDSTRMQKQKKRKMSVENQGDKVDSLECKKISKNNSTKKIKIDQGCTEPQKLIKEKSLTVQQGKTDHRRKNKHKNKSKQSMVSKFPKNKVQKITLNGTPSV